MQKKAKINNSQIADALDRIAELLEIQDGSPFRVRAYRVAAQTVRESGRPLTDILESEGIEGLDRLPGIGKSIASIIQEYIYTGRISLLERLEGQVSPEDLFATVPGIGEKLAHRIHRELNIDTLEELELAAHDGRLEHVPGFGKRRVKGIQQTLSSVLSRSTRRRARRLDWIEAQEGGFSEKPSVETILKVDDEYRRKDKAGRVSKIAPHRFNPEGGAWLPVLHTERDGWSFTAMYSNTAQAHELGMTRDWVVIYYERDGEESQCTVVTERRGKLAGRRTIRGRESECADYYTNKGLEQRH
ncbi:MAG TPA: helix-hairpin-helix domain-containing protein [Thermodesulfobacteriota bacterium]|nr:helix-hairpin-helix domain-containing protein [Thermodesulfobacteriota bacterium]